MPILVCRLSWPPAVLLRMAGSAATTRGRFFSTWHSFWRPLMLPSPKVCQMKTLPILIPHFRGSQTFLTGGTPRVIQPKPGNPLFHLPWHYSVYSFEYNCYRITYCFLSRSASRCAWRRLSVARIDYMSCAHEHRIRALRVLRTAPSGTTMKTTSASYFTYDSIVRTTIALKRGAWRKLAGTVLPFRML